MCWRNQALYHPFSGELGGFMGLLIGGSVISVVEILDLILYNLARKLEYKPSKKRNAVQAWS